MTLASAHIRDRTSSRPVLPTAYSPRIPRVFLASLNREGRPVHPRPRSFPLNHLPFRSWTSTDPHIKTSLLSLRAPSYTTISSAITFACFFAAILASFSISSFMFSPPTSTLPLPLQYNHQISSTLYSAFYPVSNSSLHGNTNLTSSDHQDKLHHNNSRASISISSGHSKQLSFHLSDKGVGSSQQILPRPSTTTDLSTNSTESHLLAEVVLGSPAHNETISVSTGIPVHNGQSENNNLVTEKQPASYDLSDGRVSWNRSWPTSPLHDETNLIPLAKALNLHNRSMINYFHMHKTGGVTLKSELMTVINNPFNKAIAQERGDGLKYAETCYEVPHDKDDGSLESTWRCDFESISTRPENELKTVDIIMGHQYWDLGAEETFSKYRDVRYFSIFRHPLSRKLSFFYHFFVRNVGRNESLVDKEEIIKFLLGENMPDRPETRDAGPNYYASRMMSDGISGFVKHQYHLEVRQRNEVLSNIASKLEKKYALVGLQIQHDASQCMLEKLLQVFAHARGIDDLVGTPKLSFHTSKLNTGKYPWTGEKIWKEMTIEQRRKYKKVEWVDLAIYDMAVRRFKQDLKLYSCEDKVTEEAYVEDVFV